MPDRTQKFERQASSTFGVIHRIDWSDLSIWRPFGLHNRVVTHDESLVREPALRGIVLKITASVMILSVLATVASWKGIKETEKRKTTLNKEIQQFYFEDYVHAEKE